jgi:hypothetical protein
MVAATRGGALIAEVDVGWSSLEDTIISRAATATESTLLNAVFNGPWRVELSVFTSEK